MAREKPILFSTVMIQAILTGRKTQTRRVIKVANLDEWRAINDCRKTSQCGSQVPCYLHKPNVTDEDVRGAHYPPYDIDDILWVREAWQRVDCGIDPDLAPDEHTYVYRASENGQLWESETENWKWRPSIHMPREAARLFLRVTSVRAERLQEITGKDARAEGFETIGAFREAFDKMLLKIDGSDWYTNPWVWVIDFERMERG